MAAGYPNDDDGEVLRRIAADNNDMSKPMDIDFQVAVPDESAARHVADEASRLGYRTSIHFDDDEDEDGEDLWTCECTRSMVPGWEAITAAQAELDGIARPVGGYADGWGTFGNADAESPA